MKVGLGSGARGVVVAPLLLALGGLASCVSPDRYDDAQVSAKHYQTRVLEQETRISELEDENRRLRTQLEASDARIAEAGFTEQIDERLNHLRGIMSELGHDPGDVTKFAVDGGYVYRVKDSILFALGSADVSEDGKKVLREVASDINSRPHGRVYVRGHTDNLKIGKAETRERFPRGNLQLSAARAVEVGAILAGEGKVDESRLVVMGFGPSDPVAANDTDAGRQKNRRVDIFVADEDQPAAPADK